MTQPVDLSRGLYRRVLTLIGLFATVVAYVLLSSHSVKAEPTYTDAQQQVQDLGRKLDGANEALKTTKAQLEQSQQHQSELQNELGALEQKYSDARHQVSVIGVTAYQEGGSYGLAKVLLTSDSTQSTLDQLSALETLNYQQQGAIGQLKDTRSKVQNTKQQIDKEVAAQEQKKSELDDQAKKLQADLAKWQDLRDQLKPQPPAPASVHATYVQGSASGKGAIAVQYAYAQLGKPYVFATAGPSTFDCSGLTMAAWAQAGVSMPHLVTSQYAMFPKVSMSNLQPGDLVTFYGQEHVGIYIGGGNVIHAPQPGEVVKISPVSVMPSSGAVRPG